MTYISSDGIVHKTDRLGSIGYITAFRVAIPKAETTPAKVYYDWRGAKETAKYGAACKICFGDGQ